ncbi:MAG: STAS domain-containing protein [Hyphomicrobium sp.]
MLDLKLSTIGSFPVVSVVGRIDNATAHHFEESLMKIMDSHSYNLIIDLKDLEYTNSTGLRAFLVAARKARQSNKRLVMSQIKPNIREIFDISGLSEWCSIYSSISEARAGLVL